MTSLWMRLLTCSLPAACLLEPTSIMLYVLLFMAVACFWLVFVFLLWAAFGLLMSAVACWLSSVLLWLASGMNSALRQAGGYKTVFVAS